MCGGNLLHFFKEAIRRVVFVENACEIRKNCLCVLGGNALRHGVVRGEQLIEHEVHVALCVRPESEVLARLLAAAADGEICLGERRVAGQERMELLVVRRAPLGNVAVDLIGGHAGNDVLGNVAQLFDVEQCARTAHFLGGEREIVHRQGRICAAPLLEVGVQQRHQVLEHRRNRIALLGVESQRQLGVLALGQLALAAGFRVDLHELRGVRVLRRLPAHRAEQLKVYRQGREPFLAADNDGRAHQVVIDYVREVVGRDTVRLQDNNVLIVLGDFHLALYEVLVANLMLDAALGTEADDIRRALGKLRLDVLHRAVAPDGVLAVVAEVLLVFLLLLVCGGELFLGAEAGVRHAALNEALDEGLVDLGTLALAVGAVDAGLAVGGRALVERQAERLECVNDHLHAALDLTLAVGILDAQIENALGLVREALVYECAVQVAEVHEARGARAHTGDLRAFGQVALRIACLDVLRRGIDMRKQLFRKQFVIHLLHSKYTFRTGSDLAARISAHDMNILTQCAIIRKVKSPMFATNRLCRRFQPERPVSCLPMPVSDEKSACSLVSMRGLYYNVY